MSGESFINAITDNISDTVKASICIIGAGAAGITLARTLAKSHSDILLIESGSLNLDGATQGLYAGRNLGLEYYDLLACRLRYFGGTTNHWGGYCRYNDPIDYKGRNKLGVPKWPVDSEELAPYITEAAASLGLDYAAFDPKVRLEQLGEDPNGLLDNKQAGLITKIFQISARKRLAQTYHESLEKQPNLRTIMNLNAVDLGVASSGDHIRSVTAKTLSGKTITIEADTFVLSCHAIENARLLLVSDDYFPTGIGNQHGHVGRYFMDHVHLYSSRLIPSPAFPKLYNFYYLRQINVNANLSLTDETIDSLGILQYYCRFRPVYADVGVMPAMASLKGQLRQPLTAQAIDDLRVVLSDLSGASQLAMAATSRLLFPSPRYFQLEHRIEQAPNPHSRVVVTDRRDALGNRVADLDWQLSNLDYKTFREGQAKIIRELSALGLGRFVVDALTNDYINENARGHYHHIGTTRMAEYKSHGVVDKNCKVFGIDNLYVAGSSLFPSAGYSGPTMMIVALALRLSEHLNKHKA